MTRTATAAQLPARGSRLRSRLALSSALGLSLGTFASVAGAQTMSGVGDATVVQGGAIVTGGLVTPTPTPGVTTTAPLAITVTQNNTVINWTRFDVPAGTATNPADYVANFINNAGAGTTVAVLNRVTGGTQSDLGGTITGLNSAVGINDGGKVEVWISNPNGILFGPNTNISTAGFVATTRAISNNDFGADALTGLVADRQYSLTQQLGKSTTAGITSTGTTLQINSNNGLLALIAPVIQVSGTLNAGTGADAQAAFIIAEDVTFTADAGSPLSFTINRGTTVTTASTIGGTVSGNRVFALVSAQSSINALLGLSADVTAAATTGNGVVVLGGDSNADSTGVTFTTPVVPGVIDNSGTTGITLGKITNTGGSVVFGSAGTLGGSGVITADTLSAASDGNLSLTGVNQVGTTQRLTSATGSATLTNGVAMTLNGAGASGTGVTITNTGLLTVAAAANAGAGTLRLTGDGLTATAALTGNDVTLSARNGTLDISGGGSTAVAGSYDVTAGDFTGTALTPGFTGGATHNFTITDTTGGLTVGALTAPDTLTITTQNGGVLTTTGTLTSTNAAVNLTGAGGISLGGDVQSNTTQSYTGAVTLTASVLLSAGAGTPSIDFSSTVDGGFSLSTNTAGTTRFQGAVGGGTPLGSLNIQAGAVSLAGDVTTTGTQNYAGQVQLQGDAILAGTGGTLNAGVVGNAHDLTLNFTAADTLGGGVTGVKNLKTDSVTASGTTTLNGSISTSETQVYNGAVTLGSAVTLISAGSGATGAITLGNTVGGAFALDVQTAGTTTFGGVVSGVASIVTNAAGTTAINANITTTGTQTYNDPVVIGGNVTLDAAANLIKFGGTVVGAADNAQSLTLSSPVEFDGDVGGTSANDKRLSTLTANGTTSIAGSGTRTIRTAGAQAYNGTLTLNTDAAFVGTTGAFTGNIVGNGGGTDHDLALGFSADSSLAGFTGVKNLTVNGGGSTTLSGTISTSGTQTYTDRVLLGSATVTTTSTGAGAAGLIAFNGGIESATGTHNALVVSGNGQAAFTTTAIGTTADNPGNIDTSAVSTTTISTNITNTGTQTYGATTIGANATLNAGSALIKFTGTVAGAADNAQSLTLSSPVEFDGDVGGTSANDRRLSALTASGTTLVAGTGTRTIRTGGAQTYTGAVTLNTDAVFVGTTGTFTGGLVGNGGGTDHDLTLGYSGASSLAGFTGVRNLTVNGGGSTTLSGTVTTSGTQTYDDAIILGGNTTLDAATNLIKFTSTVVGAADNAQSLTLSSPVEFDGDVGGTSANDKRLSTLTANGTTSIAGSGTRTIRTAGAQAYNGTLTLNTDAAFVGTTGAFTGNIVGNGGGTDHDLALGFSADSSLAGFTGVKNLTVNGGGSTTLSGTISTSGTQTYTDRVLLGSATVTTTSTGVGAAGLIAFNGGIESASGQNNALVVSGNGQAAFTTVAVGTTADRPGSIDTSAVSTTAINANISTTGTQTYGVATIGGAATETLTSTGSGDITFNGALTRDLAAPTTVGLTVSTGGTTKFLGAVGSATGGFPRTANTDSLATLTTTGQVNVSGGLISTTGAQSFGGVVNLLSSTDFVGSTGTFAAGINATGATSVRYFYGSFAPGGFACPAGVGSCTIVAPTIFIDGNISSGGAQIYDGSVRLRADAVLSAGGAVSFNGTIDSNAATARQLTVTTAGTTTFTDAIGAANALSALIVNGTGPISLGAGTVRTTGNQTYRGAVTLTTDNALTTDAGSAVAFQSTVDGARVLTIQTGTASPTTGSIAFAGIIGGNTALTGLGLRTGSVTSVAGNKVGTLAADVNSAFTFDNEGALTIGTAGSIVGILSPGLVTITQGVVSGTAQLTLANNITSSGVSLTGKGIVQNTGQIVNAGAGTIALDGNDGNITLNGTLTTTNATASAVRIVDAANVQLSTITTGTAAGATVTLGVAGADNLSGAVTQAGATIITTNTVVSNTGSATLTNNNAVSALGSNLAANGFAFRNANALTVNGPVNAGTGDLSLRTNAGNLTLAGNLVATTTGKTTTLTSAGTISQTGGTIAADLLTGSSVGGATLNQAGNAVNKLGAWTNTTGGGFSLVDSVNLTATANLLQTDIIGALSITAPKITYTGLELSASGNVTLTANATDVVGSTSNSGGALSLSAVGLASLGSGSGGSISIGGGTAFLGTGDASGSGSVTSGSGGVTIGTYLRAGTGAQAIATGGPATVAEITSTNGQVKVSGTTASITTATATNGDLDLRSTNGALTLGTGSAATGAVLAAVGTGTNPNTGILTINNSLTLTGAPGTAQLSSTGAMAAGTINAPGTTSLTTTVAGNLGFTALLGNGNKTLTSVNGISGTSIDGTGTVKLVAGTATTDAITVGSIGQTIAVASLTVNGSQLATLGTAGVTSQVTGATRIGQSGDGALTNAVDLRGTLQTGSILSTTTGQTKVATVVSTGAMNLSTTGAGGDILFTALNGAGSKTLSAFGNITGDPAGNSISSGGAVSLTGTQAGSTITVQQIGADGGGGVAGLTVDGGGTVQLGIANSSTVNARAVGDASITSRNANVVFDGALRAGGNIAITGQTNVEVDDVRAGLTSAAGNLDITATTGFVDTGLIYAPNNVRVTAGGSLTSVEIEGGAVRLRAGTGSLLTVGQIGVDSVTGPVASLTINGGSTATLGANGSTALNVRVAGATRIGQIADGALTGALTINGAFQSGGTFTSTTTNASALGNIATVGALAVNTTNAATGDVTFGALTGAGSKSINAARGIVGTSIDGAGAVSLTASTANPITVSGAIGGTTQVGAVTIDGGSVVTIGTAPTTATTLNSTGAVNIGGTTAPGSLVVNGNIAAASLTTRTVGLTDLDDVTSSGLISLTTTGAANGDVTFANLSGAGNKAVNSAKGISGTSINGAGTVGLTAAGTSPIAISGSIGGTAAVGAVTIDGGNLVTIGTAPTSARTLNSTGAVNIGGTTAPGSLVVNGTISAASVTTRTTGLTDLDDVTSGGTISLTTTNNASGDVTFANLSGAGNKAVNSARGISGVSINGAGTVGLTAATGSDITITGSIGGTTQVGAVTIDGGNVVTIGTSPTTVTAIDSSAAVVLGNTTALGSLIVNGTITAPSFSSRTTGVTDIDDVTSPGAISITTTGTSGDVTFGTLSGNGAKTVASGSGISGTSILGTGAVTMTAAAGKPVTITGVIGTTGTRAASLTIDGGGQVNLGSAAGTTIATSGAVAIGQTTAAGALTVTGGVDAGTSFAATGAGLMDVDQVRAGTTIGLTSTGGDVSFDTLTSTGAGAITASAAGGVTGNAIDTAGTVRVIAGTTSPVAIGLIGATTAPSALTISGGSTVTLGASGATGTTVNVAGNVRIGQAGDGAATGALRVNGKLVDTGTLTTTTTGATQFGDIDSTGAKSITAGTSIVANDIRGAGGVTLVAGTTSPITVNSIGATGAGVATLTVNGGSLVTIGAAGNTATNLVVTGLASIGQAPGAATGALTVNGASSVGALTSTTTGATTFGDVDSAGALSVTTTNAATGDVVFGSITGAGSKTIASARGIAANDIRGAGAVSLTAAATSPITARSIGTPGAGVAALTVNGGSLVTIGATGSSATNLVVTGATGIGQTTPAGALVVNGPAQLGSLTSTTSGATTFNGAVTASGGVNATATGGDLNYTTINGAGISLTAGGLVAGGVLTSSGAVAVTAGNTATIAGGSSTGDFAVTATNAAAVTGAVTAGGAYRVRGSAVTLGGGTVTQAANGAVDITATGGALTGAAGLTLQSNADGTGTEFLALDATGGAIAFDGTTLLGGTAAQRSDIGVLERSSGQTITLGTVTARSLQGVNAARITFGTLTNAGDIVATGPITVQNTLALTSTGGVITLTTVDVTAAGQGVTLTTSAPSGGAITATRLTAPGAIAIDARGAVTVNSGSVTTNVSGGSGTIRGATVDLGVTNVGTGALSVTTTSGLLRLNTTTAGATTINSAAGAEVTTSLTTSGATSITSVGDAALKKVAVSSGNLTVNAGGAVNGTGALRADLSAAAGNVSVTSGTSQLVGPVSASGTAGLTAGTTIDATTVSGNAGVTTSSTGATTIGTATSSGGAISLTGGSVAVTTAANANQALTVRSTAGAVSLATGTAGGVIALTGASGTAGSVTVAGPLATTNGSVTVTASGAASLAATTATTGVTVTAASISAGQTAAGSGALALTATGGNLSLAGGTTGGNATFDTTGTATLGAVTAGTGSTISIKALDAAITGAQRAGTVAFINRTPGSNTFRLGDFATAPSAGFLLTAAEINLVTAGQLTFDGGSGNIELGALAFNTAAGSTRVDLLSTGRIDVFGTVTGGGAGRTFRLGGTTANTTDKAAIIRVVAAASGTPATGDGRLLFDTADLDLRGAKIGVGQASGFLDPIGFGPTGTPLSAAVVGADYIGNPNSSLYNASFGGSVYADTAGVLLSARSLTVRYSDYALFQNTGAPGTNRGVVLGSAASPASPALTLQANGGSNAFALFGTLNGISDSAAAVAGSSVISVSGADLANTRINGCLAGSGAGCLSSVVSQPLLNIFDSSRLAVFRAADDLALPFDPVVGTNNEALFSGFGLIDGTANDTDCTDDTTSPNCQQQRQGQGQRNAEPPASQSAQPNAQPTAQPNREPAK